MLTAMKKTLSLLFFLNLFVILQAQVIDDSTLMRIETKDGNEFIGHLIREDSSSIILKTASYGEILILTDFILKKTVIQPDRIREGVLWFDNQQSSRYLWSPNGYGLKQGEGYYQNIWVLYNQVSVGLTDYFSIGAGMVPLFLLGGAATPIWIIPKFSIPVVKNKFNVGLGVIAGVLAGEERSKFGIAYGVGTIGSRDNNLNIGLGYGYTGEGWAEKPIISLSGMIRVSSKSYLLTENYFIEELALISIGGRSFVRKVGIDYAIVIPFTDDMEGFFAFPFLGITLPFGNSVRNK